MTPDVLSKYLGLFGNLHRNVNPALGLAPHKPVFLLTLLDEVQRGSIVENFVPITPELVASFRAYWRALVPPDTWHERMVYPFRYLLQDGFWELVKDDTPLTAKQLGHLSTLNQLNAIIDGGRFAPDLWQLLQDTVAVNALRAHLFKTYFHVNKSDIQKELPVNPLDYEAERLKDEAQSKFRAKRVREIQDDDGYFVRHALFPRVVKSLYNNSCSVCDLSVHSAEGSGIIDAAHIMPFGLFHNDDPRNGIALCKNHHWGFDAGWFTLTDDYRIVVSPHLRSGLTYITFNAPLHLPSNTVYAPAQKALVWHRTHKFLK